MSPVRSVLVYGMGMMGASVGAALRRRAPDVRITGVVRSDKSAAVIRERDFADTVLVAPDPAVLGNDFDLVVIGLPVLGAVELAQRLPALKGVVTDMSSTRREVQAAFARREDLLFVGSHPMCGSENAGPRAARADLYQDRLCLITPLERTGEEHTTAIRTVEAFWRSLGMRTCELPAESHDRTLAYLSHSPHLLSGLLAIWAASSADVRDATTGAPMPITGGGFKDMARIAGSNPEMWADILFSNRDNVAGSLRDFAAQLERLIGDLESRDREWWLRWFAGARQDRDFLCGFEEEQKA